MPHSLNFTEKRMKSSRPNQIEGTEKKAVLMIVTALSKKC